MNGQDNIIRKAVYTVVENRRIGSNTMLMRLEGPTDCFTAPGQFVNIEIPGFTLRRPISVCDLEPELLTIVYDIVGHGTSAMSVAPVGTSYDILPALGNGFSIDNDIQHPVLLGGGVGAPPLYLLAKTLLRKGIRPSVVLGFNSADRIIMREMFEDLGIPFFIATVDGSAGTKGFVTDAIRENGIDADYFYACGPTPMLRALSRTLEFPGQLSLESRMGCGFGACVCCTIMTRKGVRQICKDGPVFLKDDLIWE